MSEPYPDPSPHLASAPIRLVLRLADRLHPSLAGKLAYPVFIHPRRRRLPPRARAVLEQARPGRLQLSSGRLRSYSWGSGPAVLLVHGWGGRAGDWHAFVGPLQAAGLRAVAVDLPGHGDSGRRGCDVTRMASALRILAADTGDVAGVIGHALGALAAVYALAEGLRARRAVLMGCPAGMEVLLRLFTEEAGLSQAARERLTARLVGRLHRPLDSLEADLFKPRVEIPTLVVHDQEDRQIPCLEAQRLVRDWPSARLWLTRGLGHRGLLQAPEVIARTSAYMARAARASAGDRPG